MLKFATLYYERVVFGMRSCWAICCELFWYL